MPFAGNWYRLPHLTGPDSAIEEEEWNKDRVRLLLDRYGILFRELLLRELPSLQWGNVFRALRIMELSGEVLCGCFFEGIPGLQFISHRAFRQLQRKLPEKTVWWINAADPASLCGTGLPAFRGSLPKRMSSSHVIYRGSTAIAITKREGKELIIRVEPSDPDVQDAFAVIHHFLNRRFQPAMQLAIESINDERADQSPYVAAMEPSLSVVRDYRKVIVAKKRK